METRVSTPRITRQVTACFRFRLLTAADMELSLLVTGSSARDRGLCSGEDAGIAGSILPIQRSGVSTLRTGVGMFWDSSAAGADLRGLFAFGLAVAD